MMECLGMAATSMSPRRGQLPGDGNGNMRDEHGPMMNRTNRTELRRLPVRGSHELKAIYDILDAAFLAHVGFQVDHQPFVIPTLFGREGEKLYLHGSAASRMLGELEK